MKKISKVEANRHEQAMGLVHSDKPLTRDDKMFIIENYQESATHMNGLAGAYFTPYGLARDLCLQIHGNRIIDLCAGIGILSYAASIWFEYDKVEFTCLEINPNYIEVGKRILPEANWIQGDVTDQSLIESLGRFDFSISNPPFGAIKSEKAKWAGYTGADFEYKVLAIASKISNHGAFILPQMSCGFKYSGQGNVEKIESAKYQTFVKQTGIKLEMNIGIDTSYHKSDWKGVSPDVEIAIADFTTE